jgi:hypothetical protein
MRLTLLSSAFVLALSAAVPAQEGEKVTLEWKFKKGETFRYEMTMTTDMEIGGMEVGTEMVMGQAFEVTDVKDDGTGVLKVSYDRIRFKMDGPMSTDFDSDKDKTGDDAFGSLFGAMVGKSLTIHMGRKGEIVKVEGMEKMMDDIIKELPEEHQMMAGMIKGQMTDEYAKSMVQGSFGFLPKAAIAKGDTWDYESKQSMAGIGKADVKGKSTLKEISGKEATIGIELKLEFKTEGAEGPMGAAEIQPSKTKGDMVWLLDQGRLKSSKSVTTMEFTAGGQESTMTMKMEMKLAPREKGTPTPGKDAPKETPKDAPKETPKDK